MDKEGLNSYQGEMPLKDKIVRSIYSQAEETVGFAVRFEEGGSDWDRKLDDILTSPVWGFPIMLLLLGIILWITISGANVPSDILADFFFELEGKLTGYVMLLGLPAWFNGLFVVGAYRTLAWVVSVMLPPMAIFFPLFTLLEDLGYLPRVAFNLDRVFKACGSHGKQALTMCMGFGCNAAGVISCRIIDSPRERLIAILTNNFTFCNGRFPTLIALSLIFMGGLSKTGGEVRATFVVVGMVLTGIIVTLLVSYVLSKTLLKGTPSSFILELPPYRLPRVGSVLVRSILDRTIFVLTRAVLIALPAGAVIWLMVNINVGDKTLLSQGAEFLQPFAALIGLDGYILMAFILGFPANEIVLPILIMAYMSWGEMSDLGSMQAMGELFIEHGWTWTTALCTMLFSMLHFPCGTTLYTIAKETKSVKWTVLAFALPTFVAIVVCFIVNQSIGLFWR